MTIKDENDLKIETGRRLKLFRQFIGLSRNEMAKNITFSSGRLKQFEEGRTENLADYSELLELYRQYGLNATFLFSGKGTIFSFKGPLTPEMIYWIAHLVFPLDVDIDLLKNVIAILKNPKTKQDLISEINRIRLNITEHLDQRRSIQ